MPEYKWKKIKNIEELPKFFLGGNKEKYRRAVLITVQNNEMYFVIHISGFVKITNLDHIPTHWFPLPSLDEINEEELTFKEGRWYNENNEDITEKLEK